AAGGRQPAGSTAASFCSIASASWLQSMRSLRWLLSAAAWFRWVDTIFWNRRSSALLSSSVLILSIFARSSASSKTAGQYESPRRRVFPACCSTSWVTLTIADVWASAAGRCSSSMPAPHSGPFRRFGHCSRQEGRRANESALYALRRRSGPQKRALRPRRVQRAQAHPGGDQRGQHFRGRQRQDAVCDRPRRAAETERH